MSIKKSNIIFIIVFFILPANNLFAQSTSDSNTIAFDHAHQFLWFKGHWNPINKKQFILDKDTSAPGGMAPTGGTILIEPGGGVQMKTSSIEEWNKKMDAAIKVAGEWESNLEKPGSADLASYDLNQLLLPEAKADKATYTNYKIDPKTNILNPEDEKQAMNRLVGNVAAYCEKFKPKYDEIIAFWKAHKKDKDADLSVPPPPEFEYNCYACDSNLRKVYDTTIEHYVRDFFHPEDNYIREGLDAIRSFALMGIGPAGEGTTAEFDPVIDLFHTNKKDPSKSGVCSYLDIYQLNTAVGDILLHAYRRSMELLRRYHKDFRAVTSIAKVVLAALRDWALFGGNCNEQDAFDQLSGLLASNIDFYMSKLRQHDWKQLANIPFILGLMREQALLAGNNGDGGLKDLLSLVTKIMNGFHLSIDMDIKIGKDGGYMLCHLKGESKIAIDFVQNENQCYRWVVVEDQPKEIFEGLKEPVKKQLQKIEVDLLANEIIAPSALKPVYAGTKKYYALLKNLKMDFCNPGDDSIIVSGFVASPNVSAGTWTIPYSPPAPLGINGLDHFFQDQQKMQELAESGQAQAGADKMQQQAKEMTAKMKALASQMGNGRTPADLEKFMQLQKMATQEMDLSNATSINPILAISFKIPVENNITLVDKRFDAKTLSPKEAEVIVYGNYAIKIEYRK